MYNTIGYWNPVNNDPPSPSDSVMMLNRYYSYLYQLSLVERRLDLLGVSEFLNVPFQQQEAML